MANGVLEVLLVEAKGIKEEHKFCCFTCHNLFRSNPYVLIQYGNQEQISRVARRAGKKSIWNEEFKFKVEHPKMEDEQTQKLILRVVDIHKFADDDLVGETKIYVKDVISIGMEKGRVELGNHIYRIVHPDKTYTGEISVAVTFIRGKGKVKEDLGCEREATL